ncbi:hypothetical protein BD777DRAFT_33909 [Yarrowia lipolytica]|nr:hypothetical protein BD777DRAFT_33909 [Yarrowia lipolytica]
MAAFITCLVVSEAAALWSTVVLNGTNIIYHHPGLTISELTIPELTTPKLVTPRTHHSSFTLYRLPSCVNNITSHFYTLR